MKYDLNQLYEIIHHGAQRHIKPHFQHLHQNQIHVKNTSDIVTQCDWDMEQYLCDNMQKYYKNWVILGEETYQKNPEIFTNLQQNEWVIMIDPIDGTRNFAEGRPEFCVLLAIYHYGQVVASLTYLPLTGQCAICERGSGAWWHDGPPFQPLPQANIPFNQLIGHGNFIIFPEERREAIKGQFHSLQRLRCAGIDFLEQAQGLRHFSLYRFLWWWDHAAGCLLLRECGGMVGLLDGEYIGHDNSKNLCTAQNPAIFQALKTHFLQNL